MDEPSRSAERVRGPVRAGRGWLFGAVLRGDGLHAAFLQTMATQAFIVPINVATGVLVARLLGPEGRGVLAAITLWPQLLASLAICGLPYALIYHLKRTPHETGRILGAGLALAAGLALLGALAGAVVVPFAMSRGYGASAVLCAQAGALATVPFLISMLLKQVVGAVGLQPLANRFGIADPSLYLVLLLIACAVVPPTPERAALCLFAASVVNVAFVLGRLNAELRPSLMGSRVWMGRIGAYASRAAPARLLASLTSYLDRLLLVGLIAPEELGFYAVAYALSRLVEIVQTAVASIGFAAMAGRDPAATKAVHDRVFRFVLLAVALMIAAGFALGGPAIRLVYGPAFAPAAPLFHVLVVEAALGCLGQVVAQLYFGLNRPGQASAIQAVSFAASFAAMLALVPSMGALGAAVSLALGGVVRLALLLGGVRVLLGMSPPRLAPEPGEIDELWKRLRRT